MKNQKMRIAPVASCLLSLTATLCVPAFAMQDIYFWTNQADGVGVSGSSSDGIHYSMVGEFRADIEKAIRFQLMQLAQENHRVKTYQKGDVYTVKDETANEVYEYTARRKGRRYADVHALSVLEKLYPQNRNVLLYISRSYEKHKDWKPALYYRRAALRLPKDDVVERPDMELFHTAFLELNSGDTQAGIGHLNEAIKLKPDHPLYYKNRAQAYRQLGRMEDAKRDLQKVSSLTRPVRVVQISNIEQSKVYKLERMQSVAIQPGSDYALWQRAKTYLEIGEYDKAIADYQKMQSKGFMQKIAKEEVNRIRQLAKTPLPTYADAKTLQALREINMIDADGKQYEFSIQQIAKDHKNDLRVYKCAARYYRDLLNSQHKVSSPDLIKQFDSQLTAVNLIAPDDELFLGNKIQLALLLRHWSELENACNLYFKCVERNYSEFNLDRLQYAYMARAKARKALGKLNDAIADETTLLIFEPDSAETYRDRGDLYFQKGDFKSAIADYTQSIKYDENKTASTFLARAKAYEKLEMLKEAKQDFDRAKK